MKFYKIGEFSDLVGVSQNTLRSWEDKGYLKPHHRSPTGYRFYSEEQADEVLNGNIKSKDSNKVTIDDSA